MPAQISVYLATAVALIASYVLCLLIRTNKSFAAKILGFIGLVLLGPIFYVLVFGGFLSVLSGNFLLSETPTIYVWLLFGALLSPITIAIGIYKKPWASKNAP